MSLKKRKLILLMSRAWLVPSTACRDFLSHGHIGVVRADDTTAQLAPTEWVIEARREKRYIEHVDPRHSWSMHHVSIDT